MADNKPAQGTTTTAEAPKIIRHHEDTTTQLIDYGSWVTVLVNLNPGPRDWTCPDAATIRKWVDELLAENTDRPRKRDGQRYEFSRHPGWGFTYYTKAA